MLRQLDAWLDAPGDTGWVVVTGGPGMGKSAILSAWLTRREHTGAVVPYHLVRCQAADWDQPAVIAASLAAQIEAAFPIADLVRELGRADLGSQPRRAKCCRDRRGSVA